MSTIELQLCDADVQRIADAVAARLAQEPKAELMAPRVAALRTGLSLKALEGRRARGQAPLSVKRGGRVYYTAAAIEEYIKGR